MTKCNDEITRSAALINERDGMCELAKMTVAATRQKMGISKLLLERCLEKAKELSITKVILFSNNQLKGALGLY